MDEVVELYDKYWTGRSNATTRAAVQAILVRRGVSFSSVSFVRQFKPERLVITILDASKASRLTHEDVADELGQHR